jgi:four helix bundle protein
VKNFKQLRVWQKGMTIAVDSFNLVKVFPSEQRFGLCLQITKAGVSIPANIAEGSSRSSGKDYTRFVEISLGSAFELETHLLVAEKLNFGDETLRKKLLTDIDDQQKMLVGFISRLKQS